MSAALRFDFNNMLDSRVGRGHGVSSADLAKVAGSAEKAQARLRRLWADAGTRRRVGFEWAVLACQEEGLVRRIQELGDEIALKYEQVLFLGIGGSYLGLKAAQDALCPPYYNEFSSLRRGRAKVYFEGNNLDPVPVATLLEEFDPRKTFVVVISKSGETTETKAVFEVVEDWLKKGAGIHYGRQVVAITDPVSGSLRRRVDALHAQDPLSFRSLALLPGVGGRYSELNMGLLHLAIVGIDLKEVLAGAQDMAKRCLSPSLAKNPAGLYAVLHFLAYRKKGKTIGILMPFAESLKSTADWYCQLLAESLGKKFARKIVKRKDGEEEWQQDPGRVVHVGRTPVPARGTSDLHSIQQNNVEGENNKTITMIRVERFPREVAVPSSEGLLSGRSLADLLTLAQEGTEWALVRAHRPNCAIIMPEVTPRTWSQLLFFFEWATAFEGELLGINAFDQPGVESYKNYMYYKLRKPGIPKAIADEIKKHPLKKERRWVV